MASRPNVNSVCTLFVHSPIDRKIKNTAVSSILPKLRRGMSNSCLLFMINEGMTISFLPIRPIICEKYLTFDEYSGRFVSRNVCTSECTLWIEGSRWFRWLWHAWHVELLYVQTVLGKLSKLIAALPLLALLGFLAFGRLSNLEADFFHSRTGC